FSIRVIALQKLFEILDMVIVPKLLGNRAQGVPRKGSADWGQAGPLSQRGLDPSSRARHSKFVGKRTGSALQKFRPFLSLGSFAPLGPRTCKNSLTRGTRTARERMSRTLSGMA